MCVFAAIHQFIFIFVIFATCKVHGLLWVLTEGKEEARRAAAVKAERKEEEDLAIDELLMEEEILNELANEREEEEDEEGRRGEREDGVLDGISDGDSRRRGKAHPQSDSPPLAAAKDRHSVDANAAASLFMDREEVEAMLYHVPDLTTKGRGVTGGEAKMLRCSRPWCRMIYNDGNNDAPPYACSHHPGRVVVDHTGTNMAYAYY